MNPMYIVALLTALSIAGYVVLAHQAANLGQKADKAEFLAVVTTICLFGYALFGG